MIFLVILHAVAIVLLIISLSVVFNTLSRVENSGMVFSDQIARNLSLKGIPYIAVPKAKSFLILFLQAARNFFLEAKGLEKRLAVRYRQNLTDTQPGVKVVLKSIEKDFTEKKLIEKIKNDATNFVHHKQLAEIYLEQRRYNEALDLFFYLSNHTPTDSEVWSRLGLINYRLGFFEQSSECYKTFLMLDSTNLNGYVAYAQSLLESGNSEKALSAIQTALTMNSEDEAVKQLAKMIVKKSV